MALNQSHIQTIAALLQVNIVLILQMIAHYKRPTNELLNLLASVSVTSSQKEAKKMRKKRKPKRFWTRPARTGKWWQNFPDCHLSSSSVEAFFSFSLRSIITFDLCDCDLFFSAFHVF